MAPTAAIRDIPEPALTRYARIRGTPGYFPMCGRTGGRQAGGMETDTITPETPTTSSVSRQLRRPFHNRMLAGVAAGTAEYLGVDVTLVRIGFVILAIMGGAGIPLYLAGLLLIPDEGSDQSIASSLIQSFQSR